MPARATPRCSRAPSLGLRTWGVPSTTWLEQARGTHTIAVPAPRLPTAPAPPLVGRAPSSASLAHPTRRGSVILGRRSFGPTQRHLSDTSETLQRHFRDASETLQRRFGDASETLQRHFRDTSETLQSLQRRFKDASETLRDASETLPRHFRDTSETLERHFRHCRRERRPAAASLACPPRRRAVTFPRHFRDISSPCPPRRRAPASATPASRLTPTTLPYPTVP